MKVTFHYVERTRDKSKWLIVWITGWANEYEDDLITEQMHSLN